MRESALTGESLPVDKAASDLPEGQHSIADAGNCVFLGTAVQTGIAAAVIVRTGKDTAFGEIAQRLAMRAAETEFGRGIRRFGLMIITITLAQGARRWPGKRCWSSNFRRSRTSEA